MVAFTVYTIMQFYECLHPVLLFALGFHFHFWRDALSVADVIS